MALLHFEIRREDALSLQEMEEVFDGHSLAESKVDFFVAITEEDLPLEQHFANEGAQIHQQLMLVKHLNRMH